MSSTDLEPVAAAHDVTLFPGSTDERIALATDVANKFSDIVKQRRMYKRIGENDHIQIEAWQTIGALTGVVAPEGEVTELEWPALYPLGDEPPVPGDEPRDRKKAEWQTWKAADQARADWELHRDLLNARAIGRAYGFKAKFNATKYGAGVGWGEGRCNRGEASKVRQEDYALSSMAQTRAQSRALGAPLKFVVKLAGYEGTAAEEMDGVAPAEEAAPAAPAAPWGPMADDAGMETAAQAVSAIKPGADGHKFIVALASQFDGVPESCVTMLRGLAKYVARVSAAENAEAETGEVEQ